MFILKWLQSGFFYTYTLKKCICEQKSTNFNCVSGGILKKSLVFLLEQQTDNHLEKTIFAVFWTLLILMWTVLQVYWPLGLVWKGGPGLAVTAKEGILVHASLQSGQTLQHSLQQWAPPTPFPLRCHLQCSASRKHDVHLNTSELVADVLPLHAGQTLHQVHGKKSMLIMAQSCLLSLQRFLKHTVVWRLQLFISFSSSFINLVLALKGKCDVLIGSVVEF